jgi:uncharacterized membrane-anchored protein YitT (DUF2179 family)
MELDKNEIERLLTLYEEGETTLEQEQQLKTYFSSSNYDKELEVYASLFKAFEKEAKTEYKPTESKPKTTSNYFWMNIAASILVVIGTLWFYNHYQKQQELQQAKLMFENTQEALHLVSQTMNKGLQKLEYVEIFSEQKNKLLK